MTDPHSVLFSFLDVYPIEKKELTTLEKNIFNVNNSFDDKMDFNIKYSFLSNVSPGDQDGMYKSIPIRYKYRFLSFYYLRGMDMEDKFFGHFWKDAYLTQMVFAISFYKDQNEIEASDYGLKIYKSNPNPLIYGKASSYIRIYRQQDEQYLSDLSEQKVFYPVILYVKERDNELSNKLLDESIGLVKICLPKFSHLDGDTDKYKINREIDNLKFILRKELSEIFLQDENGKYSIGNSETNFHNFCQLIRLMDEKNRFEETDTTYHFSDDYYIKCAKEIEPWFFDDENHELHERQMKMELENATSDEEKLAYLSHGHKGNKIIIKALFALLNEKNKEIDRSREIIDKMYIVTLTNRSKELSKMFASGNEKNSQNSENSHVYRDK